MVTIAVDNETRKKLLEIASDLQKKLGRRVDFNETISYLISLYEKERKNLELFKLFCKPIEGLRFEEVYQELIEERRRDERL